MAITNQNSTQIANGLVSPAIVNPSYNDHGRVRSKYFNFTQNGAGDAGSIANLVKFNGGRPVRILRVVYAPGWSALGAARTLDTGLSEYTGSDGVTVAADPDAFDANVDASAAGTKTIEVNQVVESRTSFTVTAQVNDAAFDDGETLEGYVEYVED